MFSLYESRNDEAFEHESKWERKKQCVGYEYFKREGRK